MNIQTNLDIYLQKRVKLMKYCSVKLIWLCQNVMHILLMH